MKISRPVLVNASLGVVAVAAIAGVLVFTLPRSAAGDSAETTQLTSTVQQGVVSTSITASGQIAALRQVDASFATSGTIATVDVALGQTVTAGQQLGTLDTSDLSDALADAADDLSDAKSDRSAAQTAVNTATASAASSDPQTASQGAQELTSAKSQLSQAQDQVDQANDAYATATENLAAATLTSPIAGLVIAVNQVAGASAGSTGAESTAFVTIADVSAMTMTASIAEADIADVAVGQVASVTFPALEDVEAAATVTAIAPTATASNSVVTYDTTITLDAIPSGLRLGQSAEVSIVIESSAEDALYIPSAAITTANDGTSTVDVVEDDGTVTTTTVTLGVVGDQGTEILTGITEGQTIVIGEVSTTDDSTETDTGTTTQQGGFGGTFPEGGGTPPTGGGNFGGPTQ